MFDHADATGQYPAIPSKPGEDSESSQGKIRTFAGKFGKEIQRAQKNGYNVVISFSWRHI